MSRFQRDGVQGTDQRRRGDGQGELTIELTGDSSHERRRQKHSHQHQGNSDNRPDDLAHRHDRGVFGIQLIVIDMVHRVFDDHDRVVHHDSDRQHQSEQRQHVNRKT